jgi:hypothetical protein
VTLTSPSSSSPSLANGFSPCASMSLAPPKDPSSSPEPRPKGSSPFMSRAFNARYLRSDRVAGAERVGRQRQRATVCARVIGPFLDIRICRETRQRPITRPITAPSRCQRRPFVQNLSWVANQENHLSWSANRGRRGDDRTERRGRERSREPKFFEGRCRPPERKRRRAKRPGRRTRVSFPHRPKAPPGRSARSERSREIPKFRAIPPQHGSAAWTGLRERGKASGERWWRGTARR